MGKKFGKSWNLAVSSPGEALRMIEANKPGLRSWIIQNKEKYDAYRVVCTYEDGREEFLDDESYLLERGGLKSIRFTPTVSGASGVVRAIVGVVLIVVGSFTSNPFLIKIGASLVLSGIIEALSPRPKNKDGDGNTVNSYYFDGPVNTDTQGAAVPLIYGRVLAGSRPVSASISVDELMSGTSGNLTPTSTTDTSTGGTSGSGTGTTDTTTGGDWGPDPGYDSGTDTGLLDGWDGGINGLDGISSGFDSGTTGDSGSTGGDSGSTGGGV